MDPSLMWGGMPQSGQVGNSPYPTFPNPGGFGSQQGYPGAMPQMGNAPFQNGVPVESQPQDASSRSFNPWDLQGQAMARGQ